MKRNQWLRCFIARDRSRAICSSTVTFFYYVRAIHSAFLIPDGTARTARIFFG